MNCPGLKNFENWANPAKGIYRFVISAGACYEIHIMKHVHGTDEKEATANLYLVGDWYSPTEEVDEFSRELLLSGASVEKCVAAAYQDYLNTHIVEK